MVKKTLIVVLLVSALALVAMPALAWGGPTVHRRMVVVPPRPRVPLKLEKLEGDLQKVEFDGKVTFAEVVDSAGKTVRVYLGPARVIEKHKEQLVKGKHVIITGSKRPVGFIALKVKLDDKAFRIYPHRGGLRPGAAWAWRAGYRAGWADGRRAGKI